MKPGWVDAERELRSCAGTSLEYPGRPFKAPKDADYRTKRRRGGGRGGRSRAADRKLSKLFAELDAAEAT